MTPRIPQPRLRRGSEPSIERLLSESTVMPTTFCLANSSRQIGGIVHQNNSVVNS